MGRFIGRRSEELAISSDVEGDLYVVGTASKELDLKTIDLQSIKLGVFSAVPTEIKILDKTGRFQNWRKKPDKKNQYIFMKYKIESLGIRCDLDRDLILNGFTLGGAKILGVVKVKKSICSGKSWQEFVKKHRNHSYKR